MLVAVLFLMLLSFSVSSASSQFEFAEAPQFRNGESCPPSSSSSSSVCDPGLVHIAMTLDSHYLRGSMAAVLSLLTHAACPDALFFHFLLLNLNHSTTLAASFPSLRFRLYLLRPDPDLHLISSSPSTTVGTSTASAVTMYMAAAAPCTRALSASCIGAARASPGTGSMPLAPAPWTCSGPRTISMSLLILLLLRLLHSILGRQSRCTFSSILFCLAVYRQPGEQRMLINPSIHPFFPF